jgi:hypothetical protein
MPEQVNQLPKRKFKVMNLVWTIIMIAGLFISINVTNTHISVLFENWTNLLISSCKCLTQTGAT